METYVFGAGASAPYGAPTMGEFLSRAFSGWSIIPPDHTDFEEDLKIVARAIDDQYGTNILTAQQGGDHFSAEAEVALRKINVEELLALADENKTSELTRKFDDWKDFLNIGSSHIGAKIRLNIDGEKVCTEKQYRKEVDKYLNS